MESINEQLKELELLKEEINKTYNINYLTSNIANLKKVLNIYTQLSESCKDKLYITGGGDYEQKAINLRVLLTQLELQNDALISRMKTIINE